MEHLLHKIHEEFDVSEASVMKLRPLLSEKRFSKKHILIEPGKICAHYYFIEKGLARSYILSDGKEITNWFSKEGEITFSMMGSYYNKPAFKFVDLLEDCIFYVARVDALNNLLKSDVELSNWSRKLHQRGFLQLELRHIRLLTLSAKERYELFFRENPELHNRINLGHLASFLGMTQVTLSRIRANSSFLT